MKEIGLIFLTVMGLGGSYFLGFLVFLFMPALILYAFYYVVTQNYKAKYSHQNLHEKVVNLRNFDFISPGEVKFQLSEDIEILDDHNFEETVLNEVLNEK